MPTTVHIRNDSTLVTDADVAKAVAAIQKQVTEHLGPAWSVDAQLVFLTKDKATPDGAWLIKLVDVSDTPDDLGYHWNPNVPSGLVGVQSCIDDKTAWSSCLSHEVCELVVDPWASLGYQVGAKLYSLEVCDAVSGPTYQVDGVDVENFVLPSWYRESSNGPWDHLELLSAPLTMIDGGFQQSAPIGKFGQDATPGVRPEKAKMKPYSRRGRRAALQSR